MMVVSSSWNRFATTTCLLLSSSSSSLSLSSSTSFLASRSGLYPYSIRSSSMLFGSRRAGNNNNSSRKIGNRKKHQTKGSRKNNNNNNRKQQQQQQRGGEGLVQVLPDLTRVPHGPYPFYFSCRHTYEDALMEEISRSLRGGEEEELSLPVQLSSPCPGLVQVQLLPDNNNKKKKINNNSNNKIQELLESLDPIYALQSMPNCRIVTAPSIKQLALEALEALQLLVPEEEQKEQQDSPPDNSNDATGATTTSQVRQQQQQQLHRQLRNAPKGSLAVHALVPGMFKGQRDPMLARRVQNIAEQVSVRLKKGYACARCPPQLQEQTKTPLQNNDNDRWILQLLLFSPERMAVSLTQCRQPLLTTPSSSDGTTDTATTALWPNWRYPAGMAQVDIVDQIMPSSAYRKLLEAMECLQRSPPTTKQHGDNNSSNNNKIFPVIDLGACPGGWTAALRRLGSQVIAVDRSVLAQNLMQDPMIEFIKGDAFAFKPPWVDENDEISNISNSISNNNHYSDCNGERWVVSDVVAYPERVIELCHRWCGGNWADVMIITVKFQGSTIPWNSLEEAVQVVSHYGYYCRIKHFFNNKNEVTLMITKSRDQPQQQEEETTAKNKNKAGTVVQDIKKKRQYNNNNHNKNNGYDNDHDNNLRPLLGTPIYAATLPKR